MKNNYLYITIGLALVFGVMLVFPSLKTPERKFTPRTEHYGNKVASNAGMEYMNRLRANQKTGTIDILDIEKAQSKLRSLRTKKAGGSEWIFRGPDNIGGRTRAVLIDKDNSNIMYAGGVSGGLWKSTTAGQLWERVEYQGATAEDFANLAIVSITQATNGDIYFGTGEALYHLSGQGTGGILGSGIWKSSDNGQTFSKLMSTWTTDDDKITFSAVNELAADVSDANLIYAATRRGLRVTKDGGNTWEKAVMPDVTYDNRFSSDVLVTQDGSVFASVGNLCLLKKAGASSFVLKSGLDEEDGGSLITDSNVGRMEFAVSPQDANYIFCLVATQAETLRNIYKSIDGGDTWVIIGKGGSSLFQPLGDQGIYDMCIAVDPADKNHVFIGGLDLWEGNAANVGNLFAWNQVSLGESNGVLSFSSIYIHNDLHKIVFDPKNPQILFIGSDGGVSRGLLNIDNIKYQYRTMNKNYNVTQYYSVSMNGRGELIGGTQDNGTLIIAPGYGNTDETGFKVYSGLTGGDGGQVCMSTINPTVAYMTCQYGGLVRNNDQYFADWNTFYNPDLADAQEWTSGSFEIDKRQAAFVTPIAYWETDNDTFSDDMIEFIARQDYPADTTLILPSHNVNKAPISVYLEKEYFKGDTITYHDPYSSLFVLGMKRNVWLTRKAANWNVTVGQKDWWRTLKRGTLASNEYITQMEFSADGNHLFFSTYNEENGNNDIYRLSNLNNARTYNEADYLFGKNILIELTKLGSSTDRYVTDIAVDPNNIDNIIITLGNYGNTKYVYLCSNATTATQNANLNNFTDITGNLPQMPVYSALFEMDKAAHRVLLGTDMGVFITSDLFSQISGAGGVSWTPHQEGVGPVPVFQIKQQISQKWSKGNYGRIYIATHGLGLFEDRTYQGIQDELPDNDSYVADASKMVIYPNPVVNNAKVSIEQKQSENVVLNVTNLSGQIVKQINLGHLLKGENTVDIDVSDLQQGVYLMRINNHEIGTATRFVKK